MKVRIPHARLAALVVVAGFGAIHVAAQSFGSLFQMAGGMDTVKKIATSLLESAAKDPRLSGVLGKVDTGSGSLKVADQMCSMLGGKCKAPFTDQQVAAGASKLDATQTSALGEHFGSALGSATSNPLVKEGISKAIAPKLGGIVGALI
jgi:hypothetical protein